MVSEGLHRGHRRIHVGEHARQIRVFVAEVRVRRAVGRVNDHLTVRRRVQVLIEDRALVVHTGDGHLWGVARRRWRVHFPAGREQTVVETPLVSVHADDFVTGEVTHANGQVRRTELLTKGG